MPYPSASERWAGLRVEICNLCGFGFVPEISFSLADYYREDYGAAYLRDRFPAPKAFFAGLATSRARFAIRAFKHRELLETIRPRFGRVFELSGVSAHETPEMIS